MGWPWSPRPPRCQGAHVVITGGGRGIGLALAAEFVRRRCRAVSLIDVRPCEDVVFQLQSLAQAITLADPTRVCAFTADVSVFEQVVRAVAECVNANGPVDVIVANAGIGPTGMFLEASAEHFDQVMRINYLGVVHTLKATIPAMVERNEGAVIVMCSIAAFNGSASIGAYCASKFAVRGLLDALRLELCLADISIHMVCPSFVDTPMLQEAAKVMTPTCKALSTLKTSTTTPEKVAKLVVDGYMRGCTIIGSPNALIGDMIIASQLSAMSPRFFPIWLDLLLSPVYVLLHWAFRTKTQKDVHDILANMLAANRTNHQPKGKLQ